VDRDAASAIRSSLSDTVRRDLNAASEHYEQFEGQVQEVANKANDVYLKAFQEESGVRSYGEVTMTDCTLERNKAAKCGGAIRVNDGTVSAEVLTLRENRAEAHGGGKQQPFRIGSGLAQRFFQQGGKNGDATDEIDGKVEHIQQGSIVFQRKSIGHQPQQHRQQGKLEHQIAGTYVFFTALQLGQGLLQEFHPFSILFSL
jgi:hypothetical protein